jgi:hypothetical protein
MDFKELPVNLYEVLGLSYKDKPTESAIKK